MRTRDLVAVVLTVALVLLGQLLGPTLLLHGVLVPGLAEFRPDNATSPAPADTNGTARPPQQLPDNGTAPPDNGTARAPQPRPDNGTAPPDNGTARPPQPRPKNGTARRVCAHNAATWTLNATTAEWVYGAGTCLDAIGHAEVVRCMEARSPLVFFGDSVTRAQYNNLVHFLWTGRWSSGYPASEGHEGFSGWEEFFRVSSQRLGGAEVCDCYRDLGFSNLVTREERYFSMRGGRVNVSFLQTFGIKWVHHFKSSTWPDFLAAGALAEPVTWLRAKTVLFNAGIWWTPRFGQDAEFVPLHLDVLRREAGAAPADAQWHWKGTSACVTDRDRRAEEAEAARRLGWPLFDLGNITRALFEAAGAGAVAPDGTHFVPSIYPSLNRALVAHLCYS